MSRASLEERHTVMKPTGSLGTGVAQTAALVVCCIEDGLCWMTICRLRKRLESGTDEAARNLMEPGRRRWIVEGYRGACGYAMRAKCMRSVSNLKRQAQNHFSL